MEPPSPTPCPSAAETSFSASSNDFFAPAIKSIKPFPAPARNGFEFLRPVELKPAKSELR
jgi:hypothetical protein